MKQVTISKEQLNKLMDLMPDMCSLEQSLKPVVNNDIIKIIKNVRDTMGEVFKPFYDHEEDESDKDSKALNQISYDNKLSTIWSIEEVPSNKMHKKFPSKVKKIFYKSWSNPQEIVFSKARSMTWLEMWIEADKLIKLSQDQHHIFIEGFNADPNNPGVFNLETGS